jgi:hypothetical protein
MAVAWTDITNAQVAAGAPLTTALMTALRDNPEGIVQRATGAPKIFGVPYDFQEFTTAGTWTKPGNAEVGDRVFIQVVGGGEAGDRATHRLHMGGSRRCRQSRLEFPIGDLPATLSINRRRRGRTPTGNVRRWRHDGIASTVIRGRLSATRLCVRRVSGPETPRTAHRFAFRQMIRLKDTYDSSRTGKRRGSRRKSERRRRQFASPNGCRTGYEGAGGGGAAVLAIGATQSPGAPSMRAGDGGYGRVADTTGYAGSEDGRFPGGGGGGVRNIAGLPTGGNGADGVVRIWCVKDK